MQTDDYNDSGSYTLRYAVNYASYPDERVHKDFLVLVEDYCTPISVTVAT